MTTLNGREVEPGKAIIVALSALFFAICTWTSYARWAGFSYRTFDLAYYVQAIWQLIHGRFQVTVEHVPLLGNHVEPIVFLFAPPFVLFRHPMLFVIGQNALLASMGPIGYRIAKRVGFDDKRACLLTAVLLITPAPCYIALHEFHPEALAAPFLLLMLLARQSNSLRQHWLWFIAVLACKENMALLLAAYCVVQAVLERTRGLAELRPWYLWPLSLALVWFFICAFVITPALNSGNIDYLTLYDRLGSSPRNILWNAMTQPHLMARAIAQSLTQGNIVWGLLFPFLCLPLLRPHWLLVAAPILLQHLLSWRSSEWMIYFHYAAPLLPLFWMAALEGVAVPTFWKSLPAFVSRGVPWLLIIAAVTAQGLLGPINRIVTTTADWFGGESERARKNTFISQIPAEASVLAPLPYLSHLAMREKLYSLHYVLKGLKTLSHAAYELPPPTDFVLIDYLDSATFDPIAGYYHPPMQTADGRIVPSSDRLLHNFLRRCFWIVNSSNELTLLRQSDRQAPAPALESGNIFEIGSHTRLINISKSSDALSNQRPLEIRLDWRFQGERDVFPWMVLRATNMAGMGVVVTKGLCAPEVGPGSYEETWRLTAPPELTAGDYSLEAIFVDNCKRAWLNASGRADTAAAVLSRPVPLGHITVQR